MWLYRSTDVLSAAWEHDANRLAAEVMHSMLRLGRHFMLGVAHHMWTCYDQYLVDKRPYYPDYLDPFYYDIRQAFETDRRQTAHHLHLLDGGRLPTTYDVHVVVEHAVRIVAGGYLLVHRFRAKGYSHAMLLVPWEYRPLLDLVAARSDSPWVKWAIVGQGIPSDSWKCFEQALSEMCPQRYGAGVYHFVGENWRATLLREAAGQVEEEWQRCSRNPAETVASLKSTLATSQGVASSRGFAAVLKRFSPFLEDAGGIWQVPTRLPLWLLDRWLGTLDAHKWRKFGMPSYALFFLLSRHGSIDGLPDIIPTFGSRSPEEQEIARRTLAGRRWLEWYGGSENPLAR